MPTVNEQVASGPLDENQAGDSFVKQKHYEYIANEKSWREGISAYQGGDSWAAGTLMKFEGERVSDFTERQRRAYSRNFTRRIVTNRLSFLMRKDPTIKADRVDKEVMENIDRRGNSVKTIMAQIASRSMVMGMVNILIDMPFSEAKPRNEGEARKMKLRPYWSLMSPLNTVNWSVNDVDGSLDWILFNQSDKSEKLEISDGTAKIVDTSMPPYLYYDRTEWVYFTKEGTIAIGSDGNQLRGEHGLAKHNMVPVVPARFSESLDNNGNEQFVGRSLIVDIVSINSEIINLSSSLDQILNTQGFSLLAGDIEGDPTIGPDGKPGPREIKIGPKEFLKVGQDGQMPAFISPDSANIGQWLDVISTLIDECYLYAELDKGSAAPTGQAESGVSRAFRFLNTDQALRAQFARLAADVKTALWMTALMSGKDALPDDFVVEGPESFGIQGPMEALEQFKALMEALASPGMAGAVLPDFILAEMDKLVDILFAELPEVKQRALKLRNKDRLTGDLAMSMSMADVEPPEPIGIEEQSGQEGDVDNG